MSILRADSIRDRAGTGAPDFPNGATVTGVVTATSFSGNVTGTSAGLTGTPNITVGTVGCGNVTSSGDVTGVNATFSGNLTVQGTTTTIDTAVTSVDSLAVDGNVTAGGNVAIGTVTAGRHLTVSGGASEGAIQITNNTSGHFAANGFELIHFTSGETQFLNRENGDMRFDTNGTERFRIKSGGTAIFKAGLAEKSNRVAGTLGANPNNSIIDGNIIFFAGGSESGNLTINFTDIHANLAEHECCSFTVVISPNGSGVITTVTIDGQTPADGLKWSGGSAPSAGASGVDIYTFTIRKYGAANTNYGVYGAATNYA